MTTQYTTIIIEAIQHPSSRGRLDHVLVFGHRESDPDEKRVAVALHTKDAVALIHDAEALYNFPEIEVPDHTWMRCLNSGDMPMIHMREKA